MSSPVAPPHDVFATGPGTAAGVIASVVGSLERAHALLAFGAVYRDRIRLHGDVDVRAGECLRIHVAPRRFPGAEIRWEERIVAEDPDFFVVDKPAGVPFHATCDNAVENVLQGLRSVREGSLHTVQRLDVGTQGLAVVARNVPFQRLFAGWQEQTLVRKQYRALVADAPDVGEYVHYMKPADRAPRLVLSARLEGWKECRLRVTEVTPIPRYDAYELSIELLTGRNHQIRVQLAALGCPILGDALYGSRRSAPASLGRGEAIALQACALAFPTDRAYALAAPWSHRLS